MALATSGGRFLIRGARALANWAGLIIGIGTRENRLPSAWPNWKSLCASCPL